MKKNSQVDLRLEFDLTHHPLLRDFQKVKMRHKHFFLRIRNKKLLLGRIVKLAPLSTTWLERKLRTKTPKNLKVPDVMENVGCFVSILSISVSFKRLMGVSAIFVNEL